MSDKIPLTDDCDNTNSNSNNLNSPSATRYELQNIEPIKRQLDEVKQITVNNIDKVLERGEKIEVLVDSSQRLQMSSVKFHRNARGLKRAMCYKKVKCYLFTGSIISLVIYIIAYMACGHANLRHCS